MTEDTSKGNFSRDLPDAFHAARLALRRLLWHCGLEQMEGFWYAEAKIYGTDAKWWPLYGSKYRDKKGNKKTRVWFDYATQAEIANGPPSRPRFYKNWADLTEGRNVLSLVSGLEKQFESAQPPIPLFASFDASDDKKSISKLQEVLTKRVKETDKKLLSGCYQILPRPDDLRGLSESLREGVTRNAVVEYSNYVELVVKKNFHLRYESPRIYGSPYPEISWVFAIPAYEIHNDRPLLLATIILFFDACALSNKTARETAGENAQSSEDLRKNFRLVHGCLLDLEVHASRLLSHRFRDKIEGYIPGNDPVILLAHPSLCKHDHLDALRMEGEDSHHLEEFTKQYDKSPRGKCWSRAFRASGEPADKNALPSRSVYRTLSEFAKQEVNKGSKFSEAKRAFNWLKPIYCHQRARAHLPYLPSTNTDYYFGFYELLLLCQLVTRVKLPEKATSRVRIWPVDDSNPQFHWPVEPGVRLLIPWLHMLQRLAEKAPEKKLEVDRAEALIIHGSEERTAENLGRKVSNNRRTASFRRMASPLIREWLTNHDHKYPWPNGLLVAFHYSGVTKISAYSLRQMARGWRRALSDPLRHRGGDTILIEYLLRGDLAGVLNARRLDFPLDDPLFQPLQGSMPIDVDIEATKDEFLVAVTWQAKDVRGGR